MITASLTGTLVLMGAPPETRQPSHNAETVSFQPAQVRLVGDLAAKGSKYLLTDPKTGVVSELRGKELKRFVGMSVTVEGKLAGKAGSGKDSTQIVQIAKIAGNAGETMRSGFTGSTTLLLGAAAVGTTVGGLFVAGVLGEEDKSASRK